MQINFTSIYCFLGYHITHSHFFHPPQWSLKLFKKMTMGINSNLIIVGGDLQLQLWLLLNFKGADISNQHIPYKNPSCYYKSYLPIVRQLNDMQHWTHYLWD